MAVFLGLYVLKLRVNNASCYLHSGNELSHFHSKLHDNYLSLLVFVS